MSRLSIDEFCLGESVSRSTFYRWVRRIRDGIPDSVKEEGEAPTLADLAEAMNAAVQDRHPSVTPATGDIRLHARDARIHGALLRYEPGPNKNVLGYWTAVDDWADWEFDVAAAGVYEVEIQQGCGNGMGGAEVAVEVDGQTLRFTVTCDRHSLASCEATNEARIRRDGFAPSCASTDSVIGQASSSPIRSAATQI